jgi:hypothetical protein
MLCRQAHAGYPQSRLEPVAGLTQSAEPSFGQVRHGLHSNSRLPLRFWALTTGRLLRSRRQNLGECHNSNSRSLVLQFFTRVGEAMEPVNIQRRRGSSQKTKLPKLPRSLVLGFYCSRKSRIVEFPLSNQKQHIDQIFRSDVHAIPARQSVRMQFFRKLLFPRNDGQRRRSDSAKPEPIPSLDHLNRLHHVVADPNINMKACEHTSVHASFDRIAAATFGCSIQSSRGSPTRNSK